MTAPLDLDAIKARLQTGAFDEPRWPLSNGWRRVFVTDVAALLAEVERLRAENAELAHEVAAHQTTSDYARGHEHGTLAGLKARNVVPRSALVAVLAELDRRGGAVTAHEAAVEAMVGALCGPDRNQWRGAYGSIPPDPDAWHYETDGTCSYDTEKAARIALAALTTSQEVRAALVDALVHHEGEWFVERTEATSPTTGERMPGLRPWPLVDAILAALAPAVEAEQ